MFKVKECIKIQLGYATKFMAVWLSQKQAGTYIFKITFKLLIKVHNNDANIIENIFYCCKVNYMK